jgi:hypothetical protein
MTGGLKVADPVWGASIGSARQVDILRPAKNEKSNFSVRFRTYILSAAASREASHRASGRQRVLRDLV